jgi:hypothetical protein
MDVSGKGVANTLKSAKKIEKSFMTTSLVFLQRGYSFTSVKMQAMQSESVYHLSENSQDQNSLATLLKYLLKGQHQENKTCFKS